MRWCVEWVQTEVRSFGLLYPQSFSRVSVFRSEAAGGAAYLKRFVHMFYMPTLGRRVNLTFNIRTYNLL
jgi:hypothetical protein